MVELSLCKVTKRCDRSDREVRLTTHGECREVEPKPTNTEISATTTEISIPIFIGVFKMILCRDGFGESV